jgi:ABC-type transport system involved in multi-copper enzyme maturation permease subunit
MSGSIVGSLIRKDLYFMRGAMLAAIATGAFALALMPISRMLSYVSAVMLICVLIVLNIFLVMYGVAQERKEKTALFILSLPVSAMGYTIAKVMATSIAFGVPWLVLTAATAILIVVSPIPDGVLPYWMTLLGYLLAYFCALLGIALLNDSSGWHAAAITLGNVSVNFLIPFLLTRPSVTAHANGPVAVWSGDLMTILVVELLAGFAVLGYAIHAHARRPDFV